MKKTALCICLLGTILSLAAGTAWAGGLDEILKRGRLIAGMEIGYYPFEYLDPKGRPVGFDVDLAGMVARELKVDLEIADLAWKELIPALEAGRIDCILSAMSRNEERAARVGFTGPYFETGLCVLLSKKRAPGITEIKQLDAPDRIVTVLDGTEAGLASKKFFTQAQVRPLPSEAEGVQAVAGGRADAFVSDQISIWKRYKDYADTTYAILNPFTLEHFSIAVAKTDPELLDRLNRFLKAIQADGRYDDLYQKYFSAMGRSFRK
ncbi:MAG: transporter substrate-binding domain-containing protein [Proteobacteria bacterium]|nr:transporter substrate-binding domain-containing protein [Pseudomonadota bacterium]